MSDEEVKEEAAKAQKAAQDGKEPKQKKKRWPIVLGVVAVVIVVAAVGFNAWHSQPTFCNAICHTPMDAYVETYTDGTYDKYGNELTDNASKYAMMSYLHGQNGGADCLGCHVPTLGQQVGEGMNWITGNYEVAGENKVGSTILESRSTEELAEGAGMESGDAFCLRSGCHENADGSVMTRDDLIAATASLSSTRNPHVAQHGEIACSECHKGHSQSVNYCSQCHSDAPIPNGWLSMSEAKQLETI